MQRYLQFRLSSSALPIVAGCYGSQRIARIDIVCAHCGPGSFADELHVVHECPAVQSLRQRYSALFTPETDTMRSFVGQRDHMQVFKFVLDCLGFLDI